VYLRVLYWARFTLYTQPLTLVIELDRILFTLYTQPLTLVIERHNLNYQAFADDTQLYNSSDPDNADQLLSSMSDCCADIKNWMTENRLKLNSD
jgi:hypothetical protein